jgi:hypothetical protein
MAEQEAIAHIVLESSTSELLYLLSMVENQPWIRLLPIGFLLIKTKRYGWFIGLGRGQ